MVLALENNTIHIKWPHTLVNLLHNPRVRAFLDTIAYAEGTLHDNGYNVLLGGRLFKSFVDHPRHIITINSQDRPLVSTAAGRYQILSRTWDYFAPLLKLKNFSPENQDKIAIALIRQSGALKDVLEGNLQKAIRKVSNIWASLPGALYKQPTIDMKLLKKIYLKRFKYHTNIFTQTLNRYN